MKLRLFFVSVLAGIFAGVAAAIFLFALAMVTDIRDQNSNWLWGLPVVGFLIGWIYHHFGKEANLGSTLILDEIHNPRQPVPLRMAPLIYAGTILTHLCGGSAGREGTAVQLGASLTDQLAHFFKVDALERRNLLMAGMGAGFGAAIGAPIAGVIFGMEVVTVARLNFSAWRECLVASLVAYGTTVWMHVPHTDYGDISIPEFSLGTVVIVAVSGILFGLTARSFVGLTHVVEHFQKKWISYPPLRPLVGGLALIGLFAWEGSYRYAGLGLPIIQEALRKPSEWRDSFLKMIFTALTIGSGFKGGEFIPLVFIGATLGSALDFIWPQQFSLLAAAGFAAVFGAAANTPVACTIMASEIFGAEVGAYVALASLVSYHFSGAHGIYRGQRIYKPKHRRLMSLLLRGE